MTLPAFIALALAMFSVGLQVRLRLGPVPLVSLGVAVLALALAWQANMVEIGAVAVLLLQAALALWLARSSAPCWLTGAGWVLLVLLALATALHWLPGTQNPLLVDAQQLTPDAIPYTLYANFDKGWAGFCLLLALWPSQQQGDLWQRYRRGFWPVLPLTVVAALSLALGFGLVLPAPKWPEFWLSFIACNLLLTCVAEEALFRGLLQRPLRDALIGRGVREGAAAWAAILLISLVFGLAHLAGGWAYACVAAVASVGYGWAYQRSGRIEVAVLTHFAVNLVHFSLLTYPMLR
jgi:membrane protease YdiL (CAAX protease family)